MPPKTPTPSKALGQGDRTNVKYASQPDELGGIARSLFEVLNIAREEQPWPEFDKFLTDEVFIPLDDDIQQHLEVDARDRMSGTIKQRKGGVKKAMLPFVQAEERDIQNFSAEYKAELNNRVLPAIYNVAMRKSREIAAEQLGLLLRSENQITEQRELWNNQDQDPNFHSLYQLHLQIKAMQDEYAIKESCLKVVNARRKMVVELTAYYRDFIMPMHDAEAQFSFDSYLPPMKLFREFSNSEILKLDLELKDMLPKWEAQHNQRFIVEEEPFLETIDKDIWQQFNAPAPTSTLKGPASLQTGTPSSVTPSKPQAGPAAARIRTPAAKPVVGKVVTPTKPVTPTRPVSAVGRPLQSPRSVGGSRPTTPRQERQSTDSTVVVASKPAPKVLLHRDVPFVRPTREPRVFDINDTSNNKRVYIIEQQEEDPNGDYIKVVARIRPLQQHELARGDEIVLTAFPDGTIKLDRAAKNKNMTVFKLARAVPPETQQLDFYNKCDILPLIDKALGGSYVTVFAYGQTGSGKTYSIAGPEEVIMLHEGIRIHDPDDSLPESVKQVLGAVLKYQLLQHGIMPRSARYLFDQVMKAESEDPSLQFEIRCSYVEIYNEQIFDLLNTGDAPLEVKLNTGEREGFHVEGATERLAQTTDDVMAVFMEGAKNRKVSSHLLNHESSRSHALFNLHVYRKQYVRNDNTLWVRKGKLTLVDLAGSESVKTTQTAGKGLRETQGINTSLLNLSNTIAQIAKDGLDQASHIPWRNSKLTMLLMESLANNGSTIMIACVSPSSEYLTESTNTLTFATKAANIERQTVKQATGDEKEKDALRADVVKFKKHADALEKENARLKKLLTDAGIPF